MNYPLISEYIEAIKSAEDNFEQLSSLRPVLDSYGNPIMSSGNFAVVFKMKDIDSGKFYAVKCFIKDQEGRNESYAMIADELKNVNSPYILPIRFLEKELFVDTSQCDETEFPVLVMDWVEGKTLDAYLRENLDNKYRLQVLSYCFCQMSAWLMSQPFAHGDLKPDNMLVREDGSLVLVDYDGFYVPAMKGQEARELGSPDFRHPLRTANDFDEHIDDFSIATIALSLKAISIDAQLYHNYAASDRLLLSANDYHDIGSSKTMQRITQLASDSELATLIGAFYIALSNKTLKKISNNMFDIEMPAIIIGEGKTILTQEDVKQAKEKYGELVNVVIADSVTSIGDYAFFHCDKLTEITIPNSVTSIGSYAFDACKGLKSVTIGNSVTYIGEFAFYKCTGLTEVNYNAENCTSMGSLFYPVFNSCTALKTINIGDNVKTIPACAFYNCSSLTSVTIGNSVTEIGDDAFAFCTGLTSVTIPNSVTEIGWSAFEDCIGLTSVTIPNSVTWIGCYAFKDCRGLTSVTIPNSVTEIGWGAFAFCIGLTSVIYNAENCTSMGSSSFPVFNGCTALKTINIGDNVKTIPVSAFCGCSGLTSVTIPNSVTSIGNWAFYGCTGLTSIIIPKGCRSKFAGMLNKELHSKLVETAIIIGEGKTFLIQEDVKKAKEKYGGLKNVVIADSVTAIDDWAFWKCSGLTSVTIPNSVTEIGTCAFRGCSSLTSIIVENGNSKYDSRNNCNAIIETSTNRLIVGCKNSIIPNSVTSIGNWAFCGCSGLTSVTIPNFVIWIGDCAFQNCSSLTSVTIPNPVTRIGNWAFRGCTSLNSIIIPKGCRSKFEEMLGEEWHSKLSEK